MPPRMVGDRTGSAARTSRDPILVAAVSNSQDRAAALVSVMGDEAKQKLSLHGLTSAAGFLQAKIAKRIDTVVEVVTMKNFNEPDIQKLLFPLKKAN